MDKHCLRLSASVETIRFLGPFLEKEHIQAAEDDTFRGVYGNWVLLNGIRSGAFRCYGVFEMDPGDPGKVKRFCGFEMGNLDETGHAWETHAFWDRHVPVLECVNLVEKVMLEDYRKSGIRITSIVGYIPAQNRAALRLARRFGCTDRGLTTRRMWLKNGKTWPCREMRKQV